MKFSIQISNACKNALTMKTTITHKTRSKAKAMEEFDLVRKRSLWNKNCTQPKKVNKFEIEIGSQVSSNPGMKRSNGINFSFIVFTNTMPIFRSCSFMAFNASSLSLYTFLPATTAIPFNHPPFLRQHSQKQ
jgi:hypothetical protein